MRKLFLYLLGVFFIGAGLNHFIVPGFYHQIMPSYLPLPTFFVLISGAFEIILGIGVLLPRWRKLSAWGLVALLIAVYPANIHMWLNDVPIDGKPIPAVFHYLRLPLQFLFIYWAYVYTRDEFQVVRATTEKLYEQCLMIRREVFINEQKVPEELEIDEHEKAATHFLCLFNARPAATGRLRLAQDKVKFERIATLPSYRGKGFGRRLMGEMEAFARATYPGAPFMMYAQRSAVDFYLSLGWKPVGDEFLEAGIPHLKMVKA